jgi:osmoprotectant transport system substrate-binding protein
VRSRTSRFRRGRTGTALAVAAATAALVAGCGGSAVEGGSLAQQVRPINLEGQSYTVGGKDSDQQQVLCEIAIAALQSVGAQVEERCDLGDTEAVRNALLRGDIDLYWENTGTAWVSFLKEKPISGASPQYRAVEKRDLAENQVVWLEPTWFNDTDAFAMKKETAEQLGVKSLSDMAGHLRSGAPGNLCVDPEYQQRAEGGLPGLLQTYDFQVAPDRLRVLENGIYQAVADGTECLFGLVSPADPRLGELGLRLLRDDKKYHTSYNSAVSIRQDAYEANPDIARVFAPIAHKFTDGVMAELTRQMAEEDRSARQVAREWLRKMGFIEGGY